MGTNINGPSMIRVPGWANGLGRYHLYFSDHKGKYIRMAFANNVEGPWQMHEEGVLDLQGSFFPSGELPLPPLHMRPEWATHLTADDMYTHIASPDVHIDEEAGLIRMYYHGLEATGDQTSRQALSRDGLNFQANEPVLGPAYLRCFAYQDQVFALGWGGWILRAPGWDGPFEQGHMLLPLEVCEGVGTGFRHGAVAVRGDLLHIFYSQMGDTPECIVYSTVDLARPWTRWEASPPVPVLKPELPWEGADLPVETSRMGAVDHRVNALRDPCLFEENGKLLAPVQK